MFGIDTPAVIFTHKEYGSRLLFTSGSTNPRDELGKNGISFHSWSGSFFYTTIPCKVTILDEKSEPENKELFINRSSLIKYLGLRENVSYTNAYLIQCLNQTLASSKEKKEYRPIKHASSFNKRPIDPPFKLPTSHYSTPAYALLAPLGAWLGNKISEAIKVNALDFLYQTTINHHSLIGIRFFLVNTEKKLFHAGEVLVNKRFLEAYHGVPAYHDFIQTYGKSIETLGDVPVTDKKNYISCQQFDSDTHFNGKYPGRGKVDTSTGTTGPATSWEHSVEELRTVKNSLILAAKIQFGNRRLNYINAFALGPWATGLTTQEILRSTGSVFATGADKEKIYQRLKALYEYEQHQLDLTINELAKKHPSIRTHAESIKNILNSVFLAVLKNRDLDFNKELLAHFLEAKLQNLDKSALIAMGKAASQLNKEKYQILIAGYPPFLKDLTGYLAEKNFPFEKMGVIGVVGGQSISEAMRDQLVKHGFNQIYSSYGASDLDINIGVETDFEISLRKILEARPEIAKELFGENKGLPMIFHFDPLNYHAETNEEKDLIASCSRHRSSPRIRYNIKDKADIQASSTVLAVLAKHGIFGLKPKTNLPLLFIWGRNSTVVYRGANLAFTELERAITDLDTNEHILKKAFYFYEDEEGIEQIEIWLELNESSMAIDNSRKNKEVDESTFDENAMHEFSYALVKKLTDINQDFHYQVNAQYESDPLITVRFYNPGMSLISDAGGHRKQVLVFQHGANVDKDYIPCEHSHFTVVVKKDPELFHAQTLTSMRH